MTFNTGAFMIAGTAIAIAGVGLYLWDTRGSQMLSSSTSSNTYSSPSLDTRTTFSGGRSKRNKKSLKSKTKRR